MYTKLPGNIHSSCIYTSCPSTVQTLAPRGIIMAVKTRKPRVYTVSNDEYGAYDAPWCNQHYYGIAICLSRAATSLLRSFIELSRRWLSWTGFTVVEWALPQQGSHRHPNTHDTDMGIVDIECACEQAHWVCVHELNTQLYLCGWNTYYDYFIHKGLCT